MRTAILTLSDRSYRGERDDLSGPVLVEIIESQGWELAESLILPDDLDIIRDTLILWADSDDIDLILTTGGTGFAPRDITPEATRYVLDKLAPGITEAMRQESLKITPHAMLSRAVAGIRGSVLIINLPGSPKAARENLEVVLPVLKHAVQLLQDSPDAEANH
ncbi:MAG: MogA/MoaB family molybdenum cofactor biosynthesis protein [Anaerolineae bacterium]|nr:MogA/MoaB family molybdenum cofactor biosynthesis protein [Anaerolineae bacterium]MBT7073734.1 MogA/MoaB family molybdenum cofactor biosynthesis protein [Anaerolineae bacterium]MBT7783203.1 MogA/MoaB family molybdenum cofactor biosynthesis protein [Anaerolineae bacterium]